jgi:hypothetical protein
MSGSSTVAGAPPTAVGAMHVEVAPARTAGTIPARLRRFAGWLSALVADDGVNARFGAERRRDEGLVQRVERSKRF